MSTPPASSTIHSSFDSLEARMAAFKAKAAPPVTADEESKQQQQPAIDDPYDAFITPISAHNIVPAHSPMRQHSPSLEAQAAALLQVPALPLDLSSPSRPELSAGDPETPPPELPPSAKRGSVTLSNISTSSSADSPHAVDHVELSGSPTVGLVLQYASDGESGPASSRRSAAAPRVPPRSKGRTHSTDNAQSWAEAEQMQRAHAIEKELAATRRRQQEQERRAREAFATPPRSAPAASASSSAAGISPLSARSRGTGGLGSESARGDGASTAAVLNALKRKQEMARRGAAAGAGSGSQTSRAGPSSNPYAAASSSSASAARPSAPQQQQAPLTARGFLTARGGRAQGQGAYDSYTGAAAEYEEEDDDGIAGSTTARGGSAAAMLLQQNQRGEASAAASSISRGTANPSNSLADQRKREIAERKEKLRIRKANALNAITIASTPVEEGGTLQTARGPAAAARREGLTQSNGTTKGATETRRPNEGRNCELDPGCVVM